MPCSTTEKRPDHTYGTDSYYGAARQPGRLIEVRQFSAFSRMLPFMESGVLYASINFETGLEDPYLYLQPTPRGFDANLTAMSTVIDLFLCPSDGGPAVGAPGINYRVNLGSDRWNFTRNELSCGPFMMLQAVAPASMTDGLSHTVAFGEKLRARPSGGGVNLRTGMIGGGLHWPATALEALEACATRRAATSPVYPASGLQWIVGALSQTCYNHVIEPNSTVPDCVLSPPAHPIRGLIGARSNHPGGVHAAMVDGSARFVGNSIRREIWMALGTRGGGEAIPADEF